jgi:hypothetical protein
MSSDTPRTTTFSQVGHIWLRELLSCVAATEVDEKQKAPLLQIQHLLYKLNLYANAMQVHSMLGYLMLNLIVCRYCPHCGYLNNDSVDMCPNCKKRQHNKCDDESCHCRK